LEKKKLLDLAGDPRFIPGIYNYCDRWCERCTMTSSCLLYSTLEDASDDPAGLDLHNAEFWEDLQEIFQQTLELIKTCAAEKGIDLEAVETDAAVADAAALRHEAQNHELVQAARLYADKVKRWFSEQFPAGGPAPVSDDMESGGPSVDSTLPGLDEHAQDAIEIIRWYQHQIMVKLVRGLSGNDEKASAENDWQRDADGSVKVALIGMDRSIMAWGTMLETLPDSAASIHPILLGLEQLRRKTEQTFPRARSFTRPGFDISPLVS
jgi:hypothetical protein